MTQEPRPTKVSHRVLAQTMKLLNERKRITARELHAEVGVHLVTASEWLRALKKENVLYIAGWLTDSLGRDTTPVYGLGPGLDIPRRSMTQAERQRRYRQRMKEKA